MAHSIETEINEMESRKEHHDLLEIKETNNIIDRMFAYLDNSSTESYIIFKVNVGLRESNPNAYTPKMVSIGPYHKTNDRHGPMEEQKLLYLRRFLGRKEGLDFLSILLLDGCFVVEFIREHCEMVPKGEAGIIIGDRASYIFQDLMLLETQLPFLVVNKLHSMTKQVNESSLIVLVNKLYNYFGGMLKRTWSSFRETECNNIGNIKHLLHLLHIFSCNDINPRGKIITYCTRKVMPNATELSEAGDSFAQGSDITSLLDIEFESSGLMTIPCLTIERDTETLLRNLIAYEQQSSDVQLSKYFNHYVVFMDNLIDSEKYVNLLRQKGIIVNLMGDDKNVASLFNTIENGVTSFPDFYYNEEFKQATEYSEKPWNRMKANLKHNYFSSPWVVASIVASIILLILTIIQTILAFTGSVK